MLQQSILGWRNSSHELISLAE